jgi:hypothetical protein
MNDPRNTRNVTNSFRARSCGFVDRLFPPEPTLKIEQGAINMGEDKNSIGESRDEKRAEMIEAEIDKNLMDTFPASDPPSWTLGTDHRVEPEPEQEKATDDN